MRIEQREYHNIAEFFNQLEEAKKKFEETYKAKLIPFESFREISAENLELESGTGTEITSPPTYLIYLIKTDEITESNYEPAPYWLQSNLAISTYEQFKVYLLKFNPWDFFNNRTKKLTYLCHFVEEYLERELNNPGKKHLIELFKQLEIDLRTHQEVFWEQVAGKLTTFPSPVVSELVQEKLDQVKEFIDRSFAGKKEFCVDWQAFKAHEEAIIKDLEIRLTEGSYKYLHNPQLFLSTVNTQTTNYNNTVGNSNTVSGNISQNKKVGKDWSHPTEYIENNDNFELPIKEEIAENLGIFGAQRAHLTKNQETKKIEEGIKLNEIDHFDENSNDETQTSDNSQTNNGNNTHFTSQESFNVALLQWMDGLIERYLNHEKILEKLDYKYFRYVWIFGC